MISTSVSYDFTTQPLCKRRSFNNIRQRCAEGIPAGMRIKVMDRGETDAWLAAGWKDCAGGKIPLTDRGQYIRRGNFYINDGGPGRLVACQDHPLARTEKKTIGRLLWKVTSSTAQSSHLEMSRYEIDCIYSYLRPSKRTGSPEARCANDSASDSAGLSSFLIWFLLSDLSLR